MNESLAGKVALVTGAGSGIGRAIAADLAGRGMHLVLLGRTQSKLDATARQLSGVGVSLKAIELDLADESAVERLVVQLDDQRHAVDVLVHCAGVHVAKPLEEFTPQEIAYQFAINVTGPVLLTRRMLTALQSRRGQIVFVNSSAVHRGQPQVEVYASTKFALAAFAHNLRDQVNGDGVRVLTVYPGRTATPIQERIHFLQGKAYEPEDLMQPADVAWMIGSSLALPRSAEVTDIYMRPMRKPKKQVHQ
jgi:short-subunit dehydrogenase